MEHGGLRIENGAGETIRTLRGTADIGINRTWWDFRSEPSTQVRLRTEPLYADWVESDIAEQVTLVRRMQADADAAATVVNEIEWIRRQMYDLSDLLENRGETEMLDAAGELDGTLIAVEERLMQLWTTGTGQDGVRWPVKALGRLT